MLRPIVLSTPAEVFSVLASDAPEVDPATLLFDEEAGSPPQDWDRMIRVETDIPLADLVIGSSGQTVCVHIGLATERVTSGSGCRSVHRLTRANSMTIGYPEPVLQAVLVPDAFLAAGNMQQLSELGTVAGNFLIIDPGTTVRVTLEDGQGNSYEIDLVRMN